MIKEKTKQIKNNNEDAVKTFNEKKFLKQNNITKVLLNKSQNCSQLTNDLLEKTNIQPLYFYPDLNNSIIKKSNNIDSKKSNQHISSNNIQNNIINESDKLTHKIITETFVSKLKKPTLISKESVNVSFNESMVTMIIQIYIHQGQPKNKKM